MLYCQDPGCGITHHTYTGTFIVYESERPHQRPYTWRTYTIKLFIKHQHVQVQLYAFPQANF